MMLFLLVGILLALIHQSQSISIGIDLGTSNSCVAVVRDNGKCEMVSMHQDGSCNLPSVCAVVGQADDSIHAQVKYFNEKEEEAGVLVTGWKRALGLDAKSASWRLSKREAAGLGLDDGAYGLVALCPPGTNLRVQPQSCTECVLKELILRTEKSLGERVDKAVIGVPASYLPAQRAAVERAAINIGINKVRLANEPELAAHAYGHALEQNTNEANVLVFDLGGGTLDVSIVAVGGATRTMEVIATAGDPCLGGIDFTRALAFHLRLSSFENNALSKLLDARQQNSNAFNQAEIAKIALAYQDQIEIDTDLIATRHDLEIASEAQLRQAAACVRRAAIIAGANLVGDIAAFPDDDSSLRRGKKKKSKKNQFNDNLREIRQRLPKGQVLRRFPSAANARTINDVILVGAATRMPCIPRMLSHLTGISVAIRPDIDPEYAVAKGAAIRAAMNDQRLEDFVVFDAWQAQVLRHFTKKEAAKRLSSSQDNSSSLTARHKRLKKVIVRAPDGKRETITVEEDDDHSFDLLMIQEDEEATT